MSGGGSRASARALMSGMPLLGGESSISAADPILTSEVDLGMGVSLSGVDNSGSAAALSSSRAILRS